MLLTLCLRLVGGPSSVANSHFTFHILHFPIPFRILHFSARHPGKKKKSLGPLGLLGLRSTASTINTSFSPSARPHDER